MSTSEIIAIVASGVVSFMVFLLKSAVNSVNEQLKNLSRTVDSLNIQFSASVVRGETNTAEIDRLRLRIDLIASDVQIVKTIQETCKTCRN
jgi:hypothetical protein